MNNQFKTIDSSELADFNMECNLHGMNPAEFELTEHDYKTTPISTYLFTENAKVTITKKGHSKTYLTGNASHWVTDFVNDLKSGFFD